MRIGSESEISETEDADSVYQEYIQAHMVEPVQHYYCYSGLCPEVGEVITYGRSSDSSHDANHLMYVVGIFDANLYALSILTRIRDSHLFEY